MYMSVSVKMSDEVYAKMKWMKNRYQAVQGKDLTWDDFLSKVLEDALIPLAYSLGKKNPEIPLDSIMSFLLGSFFSIPEVLSESNKVLWEKMKQNSEAI